MTDIILGVILLAGIGAVGDWMSAIWHSEALERQVDRFKGWRTDRAYKRYLRLSGQHATLAAMDAPAG